MTWPSYAPKMKVWVNTWPWDGRIDAHGECNGDYELRFTLPHELAQRANTPFKWVSVNFNPMGHPPPAPPVWAVPHYDFHFYLMAPEAVGQIRPGPCSELIDCDDFKRAQTPVPARYVHADHIDVGAAVPDMGNHLIDAKSPELASPFLSKQRLHVLGMVGRPASRPGSKLTPITWGAPAPSSSA